MKKMDLTWFKQQHWLVASNFVKNMKCYESERGSIETTNQDGNSGGRLWACIWRLGLKWHKTNNFLVHFMRHIDIYDIIYIYNHIILIPGCVWKWCVQTQVLPIFWWSATILRGFRPTHAGDYGGVDSWSNQFLEVPCHSSRRYNMCHYRTSHRTSLLAASPSRRTSLPSQRAHSCPPAVVFPACHHPSHLSKESHYACIILDKPLTFSKICHFDPELSDL
jgi:hypothetical protein